MDLSARQLIDAVADAAGRWRDADFPARVRATRAVMARTGYTEPVVDFAFDALFGELRADALEAAIAGELGTPDALDRFVKRDGKPDVRYVPREPVAIVASDTTVGVAIVPLCFAVCAKARVRVKDRSDALTAAFAHTLGEERPELRERIEVGAWEGDDTSAARAFFAGARSVLAYGRDETLAAIRERLEPETAFTGFGHRTSVAYVTRATLERDGAALGEACRALARDVLLYDGEGCLSPHAVFVELGGATAPLEFARLLAVACDAVAVEFPAGFSQADRSVVAYRNAAAFRAAQGQGAVFGSFTVSHVVTFEPPHEDPPPLLRRTVAVYAVRGPDDAAAFLARHALPLEAVALSETREDAVAFAIAAGASRVAKLGTLQRPPLGGEHGGAGRILPFVRAIYAG